MTQGSAMTQERLDAHRSWALCQTCGECFSTDAQFEAHRTGPTGDRRCVLPPGLVKRDGVWYTPEGLAHRERLARMGVAGSRTGARTAAHERGVA